MLFFPTIKKGAARNRATPHLSLVPERLHFVLRAPSVVSEADALQIALKTAGFILNCSEGDFTNNCKVRHTGLKLWLLDQWFIKPERLRVLRLRRYHNI